MQSLTTITRDVWESDKRVEPNWWLKGNACDYCILKSLKRCEYCAYSKRRTHAYY